MLHKDILGRDIDKGDFVIYTSTATGLRVGMVVQENADGWTGSYTYVHKKIKVVSLSHTDLAKAIKMTTTPEITRVIVANDIPEEYKDVLRKRAKELDYE